jgi:hypothetical protein
MNLFIFREKKSGPPGVDNEVEEVEESAGSGKGDVSAAYMREVVPFSSRRLNCRIFWRKRELRAHVTRDALDDHVRKALAL